MPFRARPRFWLLLQRMSKDGALKLSFADVLPCLFTRIEGWETMMRLRAGLEPASPGNRYLANFALLVLAPIYLQLRNSPHR